MAIVPAEHCAIRGRFVPSRRLRPHRTKEARRVESAGSYAVTLARLLGDSRLFVILFAGG